MNVMAQAHKATKDFMSVPALASQYSYREIFVINLKQTHKEHKAMQSVNLDKMYADAVRVNTHELKEGDVIVYHWCLFKLVNRRVYTYPSDLQYDEKGTVQFDTECLHRGEHSPVPQSWIDREGGWTVQGNSRALWSLVKM